MGSRWCLCVVGDVLTCGFSLVLCVWLVEWVSRSGLSLDPQGFIQVNDFLQSTSHPNVFAGTSDFEPLNVSSSHTHKGPLPRLLPP